MRVDGNLLERIDEFILATVVDAFFCAAESIEIVAR